MTQVVCQSSWEWDLWLAILVPLEYFSSSVKYSSKYSMIEKKFLLLKLSAENLIAKALFSQMSF